MKTSIKLLPALAAISLTGLAHAADLVTLPADVPRVVVKYDAAALADRTAVRKLHGRLFAAARTVCQPLESRQLGLREVYERCVRSAVTRGVADVGNDNLTNYHRHGTLPGHLVAN